LPLLLPVVLPLSSLSCFLCHCPFPTPPPCSAVLPLFHSFSMRHFPIFTPAPTGTSPFSSVFLVKMSLFSLPSHVSLLLLLPETLLFSHTSSLWHSPFKRRRRQV
jgi:hypothetical protein